MNVNSFIDNEIRFCIDQYKSASLSKNQLNEHLSIKKALFVVKEKKDQKSNVAWALFLTETQIKSPLKLWITKQLKINIECLQSEQNSESQN